MRTELIITADDSLMQYAANRAVVTMRDSENNLYTLAATTRLINLWQSVYDITIKAHGLVTVEDTVDLDSDKVLTYILTKIPFDYGEWDGEPDGGVEFYTRHLFPVWWTCRIDRPAELGDWFAELDPSSEIPVCLAPPLWAGAQRPVLEIDDPSIGLIEGEMNFKMVFIYNNWAVVAAPATEIDWVWNAPEWVFGNLTPPINSWA